jgi:hypothetical protein
MIAIPGLAFLIARTPQRTRFRFPDSQKSFLSWHLGQIDQNFSTAWRDPPREGDQQRGSGVVVNFSLDQVHERWLLSATDFLNEGSEVK